ncbi:MAG: hypothetical protein IIB56_13850 [Planctomycetes bacterium]|nr:hypothetical protein [Planctomycetota bacterium]
MSSFGRSRNNVDTRLIGFPPRTTMRGGNDIAILRHLYLPAATTCACTRVTAGVSVVPMTTKRPPINFGGRKPAE